MAFVLFCKITSAQTDTTFWFAAPDLQEAHGDRPIFLRFSTSNTAASITISQPANPGFTPISIDIPANSSNSVNLTTVITQIENATPNTVSNKVYS